MIDSNGVPTIEAAKGTAAGREAMALALVPQTPQVSFSTLVDEALAQLDAATMVVIDPVARKVFVTDDTTKATALKNAATNSGTFNGVNVAPDADQEGKSLTWDTDEVGTSAYSKAAADASVASAKPKKTVASLVSGLLSGIYDGSLNTVVTRPALIVVDQSAAQVSVVEDANGAKATAVAGVTLNAGNSAEITLSEPPDTGAASKLVFEGGATS